MLAPTHRSSRGLFSPVGENHVSVGGIGFVVMETAVTKYREVGKCQCLESLPSARMSGMMAGVWKMLIDNEVVRGCCSDESVYRPGAERFAINIERIRLVLRMSNSCRAAENPPRWRAWVSSI